MVNYKNLMFLFCFCFIACQNANHQAERSASFDLELLEDQTTTKQTSNPSPPPPSSEPDDATTIRESIKKGSKVIKDGRVSVKVDDLVTAKSQIDSTLKSVDAYYENEGYRSGDYRSSYQLKIRVPSENFEKLLAALEFGEGKIIEKNISARDVTEEYVDVAIRLNSSKNYLNRYQELLKKANSIKDILDIQEKARRIEEEIDARTGRLKFIDDQVLFSTLRLDLFQEHQPVRTRLARNFGQQLVDAFRGGYDAFLDFMLFLVRIWPFILIFGLVWNFRKKISWRFWKKKSKTLE